MRVHILLLLISIILSSCSFLATQSKEKYQQDFLSHPDNPSKKIEIYWSRPEGSGKWPLILFIHGHQFPKKDGGYDFVKWGVLEKWNDRGYVAGAISQPGYGKSDGPADFCGSFTQNATLEVLKFLKSKPFVYADRVALVGISRGAIVSSMVATIDQTIRGVVLIGGSYNLEATYKVLSDGEGIKRSIKRETGATAEAFKSRSAIFHSDLIQSPTLFIHGKLDNRSPVIQAQNLHEDLKSAGITSNIALFDSGHKVPVRERDRLIDPFIKKVLKDTPLEFERVERDLATYDNRIKEMREQFTRESSDIANKAWVKLKIAHMVKTDQFMRNYLNTPFINDYSVKQKQYFQTRFMLRFSSLDKENTKEFKKLLKRYEWFKISDFGEKTDKDAWLLVQHADLDLGFQKQVLVTLTKLYAEGETNKSNYAYLYDRVKAIGEKKPQLYGTQGQCVGPGKWEPHLIEDPANVDKRRKAMGMVSMSVYKTWFKDICKASG